MMRKNETKTKRIKALRSAGFTMAELLIVVAILGVLAGVAFVAVQQHQKSVTQLQYDTIAKEIFVAAQNHLTLAKSENYRQNADLNTAKNAGYFGTKGNSTEDGTSTDIYYIYSKDSPIAPAIEQILPFGAVELVSGGQYIIRYQPNAARVLDVFYWTDGSSRFDAKNTDGSKYATLVESYRNGNQKNYPDGLLGWCGGEKNIDAGEYLDAPIINVINDALLLVEVTDTNKTKSALSPQLKLIVSGERSGAKVAISLSETQLSSRVIPNNVDGIYTVILDDITTLGMHFADINGDSNFEFLKEGDLPKEFIPGENIIIQAVAYSNTVLTSVAYSGEWTTNSLFGEVPVNKMTTTTGGTTTTTVTVKDNVYISNIRHLENLNDHLSSVAYNDTFFGNNGSSNTISAVQTVDLDWNTFKTKANELKGATTAINIYDANNAYTIANSFLPVSVEYTLSYNGQSETTNTTGTGEKAVTTTIKENHSIKNIVVDNTGSTSENVTITNAGVFGSLTGAAINNLALIDTQVTLTTSGGTGTAGTLAGALIGSNIENVVAYNSANTTVTNVIASSGSVGGLVGSIRAQTALTKCAAAVIVTSTSGNAGGLVGTATSTAGALCKVTGCYSGGHTEDKTLTGSSNTVVGYNSTNYNVTTGGTAGGLIGDATATEIKYCYATCSAKGAVAGGLVGNATGSIKYSYCTGLVSGTTEGAFAGTYSGTATGCSYFEIINERAETYGEAKTPTGGYTYLTPVSGSEMVTGITAFDETGARFNEFSGSDWKDATPYNSTLKAYYGEGSETTRVAKYILKTVAQLALLDSSNTEFAVKGEPAATDNPQIPADFVIQHYGDWPAPEIFVINTK